MIRFLLFLFVFSSVILAQENHNFPILQADELEGIEIERTEYYNGDALWGLINGGADIYLEYGFDELAFQSVEWKGNNFRVEIYRMNNEKAAFGIFSVSRYKCNINDTLTKFICITPYQVQAAHDKYYISIANTKGSEEALNLTVQLFKTIIIKLGDSGISIPELYASKNLSGYMDKLKYIRGVLGLQNGFPMWYDLFSGYSDFNFYILPVINENEKSYIAFVSFDNRNDSDKFINNNSADEFIIKTISENDFLLIKTNLEKTQLSKLLDMEF